MAIVDPRWLEILKASGWQTSALAVACALMLLANHVGLLPPLDPWMVQLAAATMTICALLAVASALSHSSFVYDKIVEAAKRRQALAYSMQTLNGDEIEFLKGQIDKGESTVQLHPFNAGGVRYFVHQSAIFQGLQSKGIVDVSAADAEGRVQTITIRREAWLQLKKKFKSDSA